MACGTPVIAYNIAAMPEVVTNGITGFVVSDYLEMANAITRIKKIDRIKCRDLAIKQFDVKPIVSFYLSFFNHSNSI
jgi:glycosyltransferase involved in cell wall biosynthesis